MLKDNQQTSLDIVYKGPAVADGSMDVRHLAPAMLEVGTLFDATNRIANGDRVTINTNVKATKPGSFHILYEVIQSTTQGVDPNVLATAVQLSQLLVGGVIVDGGLFGVIKWINRRKPKLNKINDELYILEIDGETYELPITLLRLYQDITVRRAVVDILQPVREEGINSIQIIENTNVIQEETG